MVASSNEYFTAASLPNFYGDNMEDYEKQDTFSNTEFEAINTSIKTNLFHQHMMNSVNKLYLSNQKYQTNGNLRDENYNGKFLFTIKDFVSFGTYHQSVYCMSTISLK